VCPADPVPPCSPTDAELLGRAQNGDRDAFGALAERHGERIRRYLAAMTHDDAVAEDVRQEALRLALERIAQNDEPDRFGSWLLSIAINACRQHLRREVLRTHQGDAALADVPAGRRSALSSLVRRETAAQLALAIDRLPILLREAFVLHAIEGLPYREIAPLTDATEGTLQVRTHRAKALLRQQLGDLLP